MYEAACAASCCFTAPVLSSFGLGLSAAALAAVPFTGASGLSIADSLGWAAFPAGLSSCRIQPSLSDPGRTANVIFHFSNRRPPL